MNATIPFHPLADIFDLIEGDEFDGLVADIKANGQIQTITTFEGAILDGRNRYRACIEAGVEPRVEQYEGNDPLGHVISLNAKRRHLDTSQKAMVAAGLATLPKGSNQHAEISAPSQKVAAGMLGVSVDAIQQARTVMQAGVPNLVALVRRGDVAVSSAALVSKLPVEEQQAIVEEGADAVSAAASAIREGKPHLSMSTGNNEWYTPSLYVEAARRAMGAIDVDPASNDIAQATVKATRYFTKDDSSLGHPWHGRIWMNPPYSSDLLGRFIDKLLEELAGGRTTAAIMLTDNCTETKWFNKAVNSLHFAAVCFPSSRIRFINQDADKERTSGLRGQAFCYFGSDVQAFVDEFAAIGTCHGGPLAASVLELAVAA